MKPGRILEVGALAGLLLFCLALLFGLYDKDTQQNFAWGG